MFRASVVDRSSGRGAATAAAVRSLELSHFVEHAALTALGAELRGAGLSARSLTAWAGTPRIAALPARLDARAGATTPAAAVLALFVAGTELARDQLRTISESAIDQLVACQLLEWIGDRLRARVALLPLGTALVVCDRLDAAIAPDLVCWPDDSSHHLASAIPSGRRADWLDLGCGSAFAPLSRPELAARITAIDLNPRAVRFAEIGAALSGIPRLTAATGDVADPQPQAELVTCNAPMPADAQDQLRDALPEIWRHADPGFFDRLWPAVRQAVRPGGLIVVHAASGAVVPALSAARGERVVVRYTPEGAPGFAIAWWRPDAADRMVVTHRVLTAARPHLDPRDRDDALAPPP